MTSGPIKTESTTDSTKPGRGTPRSLAFYAVAGLVVSSFLLGGSARPDVASLMILRPLAILLLGIALFRVRFSHVQAHWFILALAAAVLSLPIIHLIPLPSSWWSQLPGRELISQIDQAAALGDVGRPVSMDPDGTRNALFATMVPLSALLWGVQLSRNERRELVPIILAIGGISAILGLAQTLGPPDSALYLYDITNNGAAVGLFANRNHQAIFLAILLPLLGTFAGRSALATSRPHLAKAMCVGGVLILVPLVLITGSRGGLIAAAIGLVALPLTYRGGFASAKGNKRRSGLATARRYLPGLIGFVLVAGLAIATILLGQGAAFDRLVATSRPDELRLMIFPALTDMAKLYFPWGSGIGSFERVYQITEPDSLLSSRYINHAHNDWLESVITGGLIAMFILIAGVGAFLAGVGKLLRSAALGRRDHGLPLGLVLIFIFAIASWTDYPLRTPALSSLFVVACLWASCSSGNATIHGQLVIKNSSE